MRITYRQWAEASIEQRSAWLQDGTMLDSRGLQILQWKVAYEDAGAIIPDESAIRLSEMEG